MSASAEWRHISSNAPGKARQDEMESYPVDSSRPTGTKRSDFGKSDEGWREQRLWNYLHVAPLETFDKICTNVCVDREIMDCALGYSRFHRDLNNESKYHCIYYFNDAISGGIYYYNN
uniref:Uncharacterized protein n=1 Tax=Vespula pensylvanica TaxID=30213 RepID=A0A834U8V9_VESPE|nr:hypothetical protein H0235_009878 [Vespula pensylvanica]